MKPSNTLLAPSRFMLLFTLCAFTLISCNQNEPTRGDETQKNQPANPSTWSPVGHKYVSTDPEYPNREITFLTTDMYLWLRNGTETYVYYEVEYPIIYIRSDKVAWLQFVDTLTISRKSDLADESSCYKLVY